MALTGTQFRQLQLALQAAFPTSPDLAKLVRFTLNENLSSITSGNLSAQVFDLITWAEASGRTKELVKGALAENSGNIALREFASEWEQSTTPPTYTPWKKT